jgi:hypothetical protein
MYSHSKLEPSKSYASISGSRNPILQMTICVLSFSEKALFSASEYVNSHDWNAEYITTDHTVKTSALLCVQT